ncbi:MAG TPA: hypothetical protein VG269_23400 [Tepidisphaeraceae bacterium]|jgi:hypothetical protein|nr:hypothetical protein [Tepidisphaeraceae bacterium]
MNRPGFSFTEILFAVMILGIGFIMIAAMFPVAIKQTASTAEETVAAAIAKSGTDYLARIANDVTMPSTTVAHVPALPAGVVPASVVVAGGNFWGVSSGNLILPSDTRYAWVPFYRRDTGSAFAQVIVIGTQIRNRSTYTTADLTQLGGSPTAANLQGKPVLVAITDGSQQNPPAPDTIKFTPVTPASDFTGFAAEGCYVIIANDPGVLIPATPDPTKTPSQVLHTANGYFYRLGNARTDIGPTTWELAPGNDMQGASYKPTANPGNILAYIVGRGYSDPASTPPGLAPTGPAMDIAAYTTFVRVVPSTPTTP